MGPGLARGDRARAGAFADALSDPDARSALADSYEEFGPAGRLALAHAAVADAEDATELLLAFLGREQNAEVARAISELLEPAAWVDGDRVHVRVGRQTMTVGETVEVSAERATGQRVPLASVIDRVAQALWDFRRRGGSLPADAHLFAPIFQI